MMYPFSLIKKARLIATLIWRIVLYLWFCNHAFNSFERFSKLIRRIM